MVYDPQPSRRAAADQPSPCPVYPRSPYLADYQPRHAAYEPSPGPRLAPLSSPPAAYEPSPHPADYQPSLRRAYPHPPRLPHYVPFKRSSNYATGEKLGKGAFSVVYHCQHIPSKKFCAVKRIKLQNLDEMYRDLCRNEVSLLNKINSQNVVRCYETFTEDNIMYVALEFLDGGDLSSKILKMRKTNSMFSERTIWYIFHQVCCGIKDMHEQRILHRDLKPANVFINSKGVVKIGDLGLSRLFGRWTHDAATLVGSEYYRAPERNDGRYHFKSDVWALGCLLYELCTFVTPFNGEFKNLYALHKKIQLGNVIPFPNDVYSRELEFFVKSCLAVKSEDRPTAELAHLASRRMHLTFEQLYHDFKNAGPNSLH